MAIKHSQDDYGGSGSVPDSVPMSGSGAGPLSVRADPNDFGAQIGGAVKGLGEEGEQVAQKFGNLMAETAGNQAEVGFIQEAGALKAKYSQFEGNQAEAMRPQYEAELAATRDKYRQNLPLIAQHGYDMSSTKQMANYTSEYAGYAAGQVKQGNIKSYEALADSAKNEAANLPTVLDDGQLGSLAGRTIHAANAIADTKGWAMYATGTDKDTGRLTFGDSPEAQGAQAQYNQALDTQLAGLYMTGAKTIADNQGATAAANWAQKHWDMMPDAAKVQMNAYIAPKVKNEIISGNVVNMTSQANDGFNQQQLAHVPGGPLDTPPTSQNPLAVINKNEGQGYSKDNKGEVVNGINSVAFPKEFAEAKSILDTQGQAAANKYSDAFYQKNIIDKYGISSLPANTQAIVADGLVNHGGGDFGQSLVQAAKDGATPQQLIDMRRAEYSRLNATGKPEYTSQFQGWNDRLDKLEAPQQMISSPNKADYLRENGDTLVGNAVNNYLKKYPDDYYGAQLQEKRAQRELTSQISIEDRKLKSDRDTISNAISGAYTKGQPPATYEDLKAIPQLGPVLDRVHTEQGAFAGTIDTMIDKASHRDANMNSPNGYDTIMRTLEPHGEDHPNAIASQDHLDRLLGKSDGTGISWKDYQDAKPLLEADQTFKDGLSQHMADIANANGNLDGKGQQRALSWYSQVMDAKKTNDSLPPEKKLSDAQFIAKIGEKDGPPVPAPPSRMQQILNWHGLMGGKTQQPAQPFNYDAVQKGQQYTAPDGTIRTKQ